MVVRPHRPRSCCGHSSCDRAGLAVGQESAHRQDGFALESRGSGYGSRTRNAVFYGHVAEESLLVVFAAVRTNAKDPSAPPEVLAANPADNYHRWWNNSWRVVEPAGQPNAGAWTPEKDTRLNLLVRYAHAHSLWIRFYTLDGATKAELSCNGWFSSYNFGSQDAVQKRWEAAAKAGADYIATDQYEVLDTLLKARK